jgi:hypothetical protein
VCYSREERERWEQMLAREADEERLRSIELEPEVEADEPETEREERREDELIRA